MAITRKELESLKKFDKLISNDGDILEFQEFDDTGNPVAVRDKDDIFSWVTLKEVSIQSTESKIKGVTVDSIKSYFEKHKDMLLTIAFVLILDHFIFNGVFKDKVKNMLDSFLNKRISENGK